MLALEWFGGFVFHQKPHKPFLTDPSYLCVRGCEMEMNTEQTMVVEAQLLALKAEHQDLDQALQHGVEGAIKDELLLRRMKKRKLLLKDRILALERLLAPSEPA